MFEGVSHGTSTGATMTNRFQGILKLQRNHAGLKTTIGGNRGISIGTVVHSEIPGSPSWKTQLGEVMNP